MMGIDQIKQKVKNQKLGHVVALGGSDRALIDDAIDYLRQTFINEASKDLNFQKLVVGEDDLTDVITNLYTAPFLASKRFIEIHGPENLSAALSKDVLNYINDPCPTSLAVLVFSKIDKRSKLVSNLTKNDQLFLFDIPSEGEQVSYIVKLAKSHGFKIKENVAQFLAVLTNNDTLAMKEALKKLSLQFEGGEVSIENIEQHIADSKEQDVFLLARLICQGDLSQALLKLAQLRAQKENAIKFLGVLMWQFRTVLHIRHCLDKGMPEWDIRREVSVFGERFSWMAIIAKKRHITFHMKRLTRLIECDRSIKSLNISDHLNLIEKVVYQSAIGIKQS